MAYRLPSPWNPGYAVPDNVQAEGLERRAFVTKQARRGTYDDPTVGTGGYVVPQYVQSEGYGRGVHTTAWAPSGSTPGVSIPNYLNQRPHTVASSPLPGGGAAVTRPTGAVAVPPAYQAYGRKAASIVLKKLQKVPPAAQPQQLKAALDGIDRKLHPRAMKATKALGNLHAGLAHAFGATLLEQVIETGKSGRAPRKGLMTMGSCGICGSRSALGATPLLKAKPLLVGNMSSLLAKLLPNAASGPGGIAPGTCDSSGQYIWDAGGFWRRMKKGETCLATSSTKIDVTDHRGGFQGGGYSVVDANGKPVSVPQVPTTITPGTTKLITVGPFTFPLVDQMNIHWSGLLPQSWRDAINAQLTKDCHPCIESSMRSAGNGTIYSQLRTFLGPEMPSTINHDFFGVNYGGNYGTVKTPFGTVSAWDRKPSQPIATTTRPDNGEKWALYAYLEPRDNTKVYNADTNPWNLRIVWRKADESVWGWIWDVISTIGDWAEDAIDAIGSLTCDLLTNPVGQAGAVAAGAAAGGAGGAQAGAAGASIGAQMCAQPPPTVVQTSSSILPLAILGAGVIGAGLLITRKKKP